MSKFFFFFLLLFSMVACQYEEACENQVCINGFCTAGICDCFDWYEGVRCHNEVRNAYYGTYNGYAVKSNNSDTTNQVVVVAASGELLQEFSSNILDSTVFVLSSKDTFQMNPLNTDSAAYFGHGFRHNLDELQLFIYEVRQADTILTTFLLDKID